MNRILNTSRRSPEARAATKGRVAARVFAIVASILFWVAVWFLAAKKIGHEVILPSPGAVLTRLGELAAASYFWLCVVNSLAKVMLGLLIGIALAIPLAAIAARFAPMKILLDPLIITTRATPVASFIILIWTVLGSRGPSLVPIFISFLIVFPVVYSAVFTAIGEVDLGLLEVARIYRLGVWKRLRFIYFPSVFGTAISACATAAGLAWKAGIAAEVLSQTRDSIGFEIYSSKAYLETTDLFAYTLTVIILSLGIELLLRVIKSRVAGKGVQK